MVGDLLLVGFVLLAVLLVAFEDTFDKIGHPKRADRIPLERRERERRVVVYMNLAWEDRRSTPSRRKDDLDKIAANRGGNRMDTWGDVG